MWLHILYNAKDEETIMREFKNELVIKEEEYSCGLFPVIPNYHKQESAYILTDGVKDSILVDQYTTTRHIRMGRYRKLVEISTIPYIKEIYFSAPSEDTTYKFNVYIKATIQIDKPLIFFGNRNIDVDAYFQNLFLQDVKRITRKYSILSFEGMDDELKAKLSMCNTVDSSTGFVYQISSVSASLDEEAEKIVRKRDRQKMDAKLYSSAKELSNVYTTNYNDAVLINMVQNNGSLPETIREMERYENEKFEQKINRLEVVRDKGLITDKEARQLAMPVLENMRNERAISLTEQADKVKALEIDNLYEEDK